MFSDIFNSGKTIFEELESDDDDCTQISDETT